MTGDPSVPHVLLACAGLDHAHRGYESFARECFEALRDHPGVRIELVKGSGPGGPAERAIPTLRRDRVLARSLGRAFGFRPFRLEGLAFGLSLQPLLTSSRPSIVYLSEWDTARALALLRRATSQRFKLLYCNGGFASQGFEHLDRVQELTPAGRDWVLERGADPARHTLLPMGVHLEHDPPTLTHDQRRQLRSKFGLPTDRQIIVSVAALNTHHKRLDYLIDEVAALPEPRPFLLLDGQPEEETPAVRERAQRALGAGGYEIRTSPTAHIPAILRATDVFVLASLWETQARALIEAAGQRLPCIAHDSPVTRYAVSEQALFGDLSRPGALTQLLHTWRATEPEQLRDRARACQQHAYERFSWERLRARYVELFAEVANSTVSSSRGAKLRR